MGPAQALGTTTITGAEKLTEHANGPRELRRPFGAGFKIREARYALTTLPDLMQLVHTRMRLPEVFTFALTVWRLTFQRRRVTLCACETLLPNCGFLPQISHICAMICILYAANVDVALGIAHRGTPHRNAPTHQEFSADRKSPSTQTISVQKIYLLGNCDLSWNTDSIAARWRQSGKAFRPAIYVERIALCEHHISSTIRVVAGRTQAIPPLQPDLSKPHGQSSGSPSWCASCI